MFAFVVISHEKGLTVVDQLRTVVRQCYGWSVPYGVSGHPSMDFSVTGEVASDYLKDRTRMLGFDLERYSGQMHGLCQEDLKDATPVFADIDPFTLALDPDKAEEKITCRTKAILAVDVFGHPADWDRLEALAKKYRLALVEDSADAIGSQYRGRRAGSCGD